MSFTGIAASMSNETSNFSGISSYVAADVISASVICNGEGISVPSLVYQRPLIQVKMICGYQMRIVISILR